MAPLQILSPYRDRAIELDGLAITMLALGGTAMGIACFYLLSGMTHASAVAVAGASSAAACAVLAAWLLGYPHRATLPATAFALVCAVSWLPRLLGIAGPMFDFVKYAAPADRYVIEGLSVGGLAILTLGFMLVGFVGPLIGAIRLARERVAGSKATLLAHLVLFAGAVLIKLIASLTGLQH